MVGGDDFFGCFPPARKPCPEEDVTSDEEGVHRKTALYRSTHLRLANVGRR